MKIRVEGSTDCSSGIGCSGSGTSAGCNCGLHDASAVSDTCCSGTTNYGGLCCTSPVKVAGIWTVYYNDGGICTQANTCGVTLGVDVTDVNDVPPFVASVGGDACCPNIDLYGVTGNWYQIISTY